MIICALLYITAASAAPVSPSATSVTFSYGDYGQAFTVVRGVLYTITWPVDHPFEVSQTELGIALNASFEYKRDDTTTSFRVPTSYTGVLFYYCAKHKADMQHGQITLKDAPTTHTPTSTTTAKTKLDDAVNAGDTSTATLSIISRCLLASAMTVFAVVSSVHR